MKHALIALVLCTSVCVRAQNEGIETPSPNTNAKPGITATDKGLLVPRMEGSSSNIGIGYSAIPKAGGDNNVGIGANALSVTSGQKNTCIGINAMAESEVVAIIQQWVTTH